MGVIYKIVNLVNNKEYIGSAIKFNIRKNYHLTCLRKNKHHSIKLQRSFNKYGESNFIFYILEDNIKREFLLEKEQEYLNSMKPELNTSKYAVSGIGRFKDKVVCFDLKGNLLNEFNCADKAGEFYNISPTKIRLVCNRKRNFHKKMSFRWSKYVKKYGLDVVRYEVINFKQKHKEKNIRQYDLTGNFIKKWSSVSDASKKLNLSYESIRRCCNGLYHTAGNFKWKYDDDKLHKISSKKYDNKIKDKENRKKEYKYLNRKGSIPIIAISLKDNKITEFPSMMEAQRKLNVSQSNIWKVLKGQISKCNGYRFEYKN